jgi:hypothetical protein
VVVMPGGIGAVVYSCCGSDADTMPHCSTEFHSSVHSVRSASSNLLGLWWCFRGFRLRMYCAQCGHDLAKDHAPARLRVYSD